MKSNIREKKIVKVILESRTGLKPRSGKTWPPTDKHGLFCEGFQRTRLIRKRIFKIFQKFRKVPLFQHRKVLNLCLLCVPASDPGCSLFVLNSGDWLQMNIGRFSKLVSLEDLFKLNPSFSPVLFCRTDSLQSK